jgi:hypothetical protein
MLVGALSLLGIDGASVIIDVTGERILNPDGTVASELTKDSKDLLVCLEYTVRKRLVDISAMNLPACYLCYHSAKDHNIAVQEGVITIYKCSICGCQRYDRRPR